MLSAIVLLMATSASEFNDNLHNFPIGFWNYAPIEVFDEAKIQEWADAGMTLTMGPEFAVTPENVARMNDILDWAYGRGIRVIICDPRTRARNPLPEDFKAGVAQAMRDFALHRGTFGFHILDEPDVNLFQPTCDAVRMVKQAAPNLYPFVNLLPWHPGVNPRVGFDDWAAYLDAFVKTSGVDFLCYDCYSQMNPEKSGWPMYFKNLNDYREAAKRSGIPFWNTILSVGHFNYRCPSEDDIRWQFNTSIAYGAQGILYFFFYMRAPHDNYRLSPIDEFWDKTPTFDSLKRVNKGFLKRYGRLFLQLDFQKAMQWPEPVTGCLPFEPDEVIREVRTEGQFPIIVSRFADGKGRPWIALVNNSTTDNAYATLVFNGANTKAFQMSWSAKEGEIGVERGPDCVTVSHWLMPGQMEVYRVEPAQ